RREPRLLVRPEPPGRGLGRDLRGLAAPGLALAVALPRLVGAAQARVRRRADARDRRPPPARARPRAGRPARADRPHPARALPAQARPLPAGAPAQPPGVPAMKRLRVLVLTHEDLVPPESIEGLSEKEILPWK